VADVSDATGSSLGATGPLDVLDRALGLVRRAPLSLLARAFLGCLPLWAAVLIAYALEQVEGVRGVRPQLALLLVAGFAYRALVLSEVARTFVAELRPALASLERGGDALGVVSTAAWVGMGLCCWLWPLGVAVRLSLLLCVAFLPLLSVRGAVAPSWLARARCAPERGLRAFGLAFDDTAGLRAVMASVELGLLVGLVLTAVNLYALLGLALVVASSMLGLQTAFASAFVSLDNDLVPLVLAMLALTLFEPLRAACSAWVYCEARGRRDGADLHAALDAVIERAQPRSQRGRFVTVLWLGWLLCQPRAHADPRLEQDARTQAKVEAILSDPEFVEIERAQSKTFLAWVRDYLDELFEDRQRERDANRAESSDLRIELPEISPWAVMLFALLSMWLVLRHVRRELRGGHDARAAAAGVAPELLQRAPQVHMSDAATWAERGQYREALRSLYVATLGALDRAGVIAFEPARTNGQYLRAMAPGELRQQFGAFTLLFDHRWYGHEPTQRADYELCRDLAARICEATGRA
jgi:Domain of unknown function (DUF4129)